MTIGHKVVGVLGGMGPGATIDFLSKVLAATPAQTETDHVHLLVDQNPKVPSRQAAILEGGEDPGPALAAMAARLESAGADFLVMPCNTAHVFQDRIEAASRIPLVSIIDVTIDEVERRAPGVKAVGLLATEGCLQAGVYQRALEARGIVSLLPCPEDLGRLMEIVYAVKIGRFDENSSMAMRAIANTLVEQGARAIIIGCTEVPLVLNEEQVPVPLIESTGTLARVTVALARGELPLPAKET